MARTAIVSALAFGLLFALTVCSVLAAGDYTIGPADVIKITVFNEPELSRTVRVAADGTISFPLLGNVEVAGLTPTALEEKLEKLLGERYLVEPQVWVEILEYNSQKVYVLGAVKEPGYYELRGPTTLLEVISRAGGITSDAGKAIVITSKDTGGEAKVRVINREKLLVEGEVSLDVRLSGGDVVYVPRAKEVYVFGEVKKPGAVMYQEGLTVLQAVSLAGGLTDMAAPRRVRIIRNSDGKRSTIEVDLKEILKDASKDIEVLPSDVVIVPRSLI
ncbi:MAG TPA: hypothetical protein ENF73_04860 [Proteobacteria bacterium]|nr:hypothetical protein [Pseudomonadota bacterium]